MKLMTREILEKLPKFGMTRDMDLKPIIVKYFTLTNWYWYVLEGEKQQNGDILFYGLLVDFHENRKYDYFLLSELESIESPRFFFFFQDSFSSDLAINKDGLVIKLDKKNQIQGILIGDQGLEVVNINTTDGKIGLKEFYHLLDCEVVEHLSLNDELGMWFDEMGLFKNGNFIQSYAFDGEELPQIPGKVLILAEDDMGNSIGLTEVQIGYIHNNLSAFGRNVIDHGDEESNPRDLAETFAAIVTEELRKVTFEDLGISDDDLPF